jgi:hypothetical protein
MAHRITYITGKENDFKKANIELVRGDSMIVDLSLNHTLDDDTKEPYVPNEGDCIIFTLRKNYKSLDNDEIVLQKMVDIFTDPTLEIEPSDTNSLDYGTYKYDIQFDSFDGIVDTVLQGTFKLAKEVT